MTTSMPPLLDFVPICPPRVFGFVRFGGLDDDDDDDRYTIKSLWWEMAGIYPFSVAGMEHPWSMDRLMNRNSMDVLFVEKSLP